MILTETGTASNSSGADDSSYLERPKIADLNGYYTDADSADQSMFAEMRSNILLAAGDHYTKRQSTFFRRIRDSKELSEQQKIRLTKNHVRKICQVYANNIMSTNPGVGFMPKDENNMHDMKVSDMHHSVWQDGMAKYFLTDAMDDWCDSFVQIGEVHVKLFYDPTMGPLKGYEQKVDEVTGAPSLNEFMQPVPDESKPQFEGEMIFEEVYGFNLLRPPECKDLRKAEWLGVRKMVDKLEFQRKFKDDPELLSKIKADQDETYVIFDALNGGYKKSNKQTMLREYYFRPSQLFPQGYFYITTKEGILSEGELPGGFFPIVSTLFDRVQTTPRGRSPVKTMRPYQAEINRSASKIAEHQITLGDDKLLLYNGSKASAGVSLPGVRTVNVTGSEPKVMAGRDGSQYAAYNKDQITELYMVMMVQEQDQPSEAKADPYMMLFASAKQKKKFQRYIGRFENFLVEIVKLYLKLCKIHLPDDAVVLAVGKNEQVNIAEFRAQPDTCYEVKVEPQSEDIETKMGKQLVLNHAIQYVGTQLKPEDIGKLMRAMPFANFDESFSDLTIDYDSAQNDMLALDRGEQPPVNQYDNHVYMIKRLTQRVRKSDFQFLPPPVQQSYNGKIQLHQQFEAQNQLAIQRAEQGFIPTGGYLVTCDFYVKDPSDQTGVKTRRARVPYQAMEWLMTQLASQGASQDQIQDMNGGAQAQLANTVTSLRGPQAPGGMPSPGGQPPMGPSMHGGAPPPPHLAHSMPMHAPPPKMGMGPPAPMGPITPMGKFGMG